MKSIDSRDSAATFLSHVRTHQPELLDLVTAETDDELESAFSAILLRIIHGLETNAGELADLNENGLSAVLAIGLNSSGLPTVREEYSNGHVDLTITIPLRPAHKRKLGEAKVWDGAQYHISGVRQLLGRYSTGRESRGFVISYVKQRDIRGLFDMLRQLMDETRPCDQCDPTNAAPSDWRFVSRHKHSSGEIVEIGHFGCNLYIEPITPRKV